MVKMSIIVAGKATIGLQHGIRMVRLAISSLMMTMEVMTFVMVEPLASVFVPLQNEIKAYIQLIC